MPCSDLLLSEKLFCMPELMLHSLVDAEHWETLLMCHAVRKKRTKTNNTVACSA